MHGISKQQHGGSGSRSCFSSSSNRDDVVDEQPVAADTAAAAESTADATLLLSDDMINIVATFASCRDLCSLGQVCRRFSPLPFQEDLWELRALDVLPRRSQSQLRSAMAMLSLASCRELVETFARIGIPGGVLGFWQAEPPSPAAAAAAAAAQAESPFARLLSTAPPAPPPQQQQQEQQERPSAEELEARGELLRIGLEAGGFVCESVAPNGARRRIFTIRVSKTDTGRVKIGFFSQEREFSLTIGGGDDDWVPGDSMAEAKARYTFAVPGSTKRSPIRSSGSRAFFLEREDGRVCRYVKLTAPPLPPSSGEPAAAVSGGCGGGGGGGGGGGASDDPSLLSGLWCAPYGSHGLEIIQLSTESSCSPFDGAADAEAAAAAAACAKSPTSGSAAAARSPSWSRASISRMTDGSESVCTSAPATDDGDGSEAGFSCGECSGGGNVSGLGGGSGSSDATSESDSGDDEAESSAAAAIANAKANKGVDCLSRTTTNKRRKRHRGGHHHHNHLHDHQLPATAGAADTDADADATAVVPSQLFGFKVTGDENVPAGKTSFVIDLLTRFDVDEELRSDSRPVVMFLSSGAVMANLANRREQVTAWHKGRGQINRVPGRWLPQWVDVDFVAYRPGSRCAFSVIFRQPEQAVRVVMDFEKAHGCEEGWPQWPAAAVAPPPPPAVDGGDAAQSQS